MIPYSFNGEVHYLSIDEFQAVEASGRCSLGEYITTPTEYPKRDFSVFNLMGGRPGMTEPGELPVEVFLKPVPEHVKYGTVRRGGNTIHLCSARNQNKPVCGEDAPYHEVVGFGYFSRMKGSPKACAACLLAFDGEMENPRGRRPHVRVFVARNGYYEPAEWTPEEKRRLELWRSGGEKKFHGERR